MHTHRLSAELSALQERTGDAGYRLDDLLNLFGDRGFGVFLILFSIPSALPIPAPGYSTPFGLILVLIGGQMLLRHTRPWLPRRARDMWISPRTGRRIASALTWIFAKLERLVRPRFPGVTGPHGTALIGALVALMGTLMSFPIPLTNTAPAFVILVTGIGLLEKDGLFTAGALVLGLALSLFYAAAFFAVFHFGLQGMDEVKEIVKDWLGQSPESR